MEAQDGDLLDFGCVDIDDAVRKSIYFHDVSRPSRDRDLRARWIPVRSWLILDQGMAFFGDGFRA